MAFSFDKQYAFDEKKAEEGAKLMVGPDKEDYILVCRLPNKKYSAELTRVMLQNSKVLEFLKAQDNDKYSDKDRELQAQVLAKTIFVGWGKNFLDNGKAVKYSVKECTRLLLKYPDFRADGIEFASDISNYPPQLDIEDSVKK